MTARINLTGEPIGLDALRAVVRGAVELEIAPDTERRIEAAHHLVGRLLTEDAPVYGLNTGFGSLAQTRIERERLGDLQRNLVLSHAAGVGPALSDAVVRTVLVLKLVSLARGHSGVRPTCHRVSRQAPMTCGWQRTE